MLFKHDMTMYAIRLLLIVLSALLLAGTARAQNAWINEIHYDNDGGDEGEFVEVVVENAGDYDLGQLEIVLYNGSDMSVYGTTEVGSLTGTADGDFTVFAWFESGIQNGAPDGVALCYDGSVISSGGVAQFLSYEGTFTASGGCADGLISTDIGLTESSSAEIGESLQLTGDGGIYSAFSWTGPVAESPGSVNTGQTLSGGGGATTTVWFAAASATVLEGDAGTTTYDVTVSITNPDDDNDTTADVVATGGSADGNGDDYSYSTTPVTFPAGSSDDQTVSVTIIGDADLEPDETITFELQNVDGGDNASVGVPSTFTLTIQNDEVPDVLITELMSNPSVSGDTGWEWFEVFNASSDDIELNGWTITDDGNDSHTIGSSTIVPANGFAVLCDNSDGSTNGGFTCDYEYSSFSLANTSDEIVLTDGKGSQVDRVAYGSGNPLPTSPDGEAFVFIRGPSDDNNDASNWVTAGGREGTYDDSGTDLGSPGTQGSQQNLLQILTVDGTEGEDNDAGWRMLASPVAGATRADLGDDVTFSTGTGEMFYTWDGADWAAGAGSTSLTNGTGFILYLFDDATDPIDPDLRLDVPGTSPEVDVTVSDLDQSDTWHLLGNPYGQSFDLSGLDLTGSGFQAVAHLWDPASDTYKLITESGDASDLVAAWQGFFVQRTSADAGATALTFDATSRTTGATFYGKQGRGAAVADYRKLGLRLRAFDESGDEAARDEAASLYFSPQATHGWDTYDATKASVPPGAARAELVLLGEYGGGVVEKAQESRALDPEAFEVELATRVEGAGDERVLEWPVWEHVPEAWTLELTDRATNTTVDLRAEANYAFEAVEYEGPRFVLRVGATATAMDEEALPERLALSVPHPNPARAMVRLEYALPAASEVRVAIYDVLGREVAVVAEGRRAAGVQELTWHLPTDLASGLYVVRLEADAQVRTRRMVVVR